MATFSSNDIESWERFFRANFINSLTGFKSVSLIGTINEEGHTNLGVFSSIVHIGSNPALVGYINRPVAAAPHTLTNIQATGYYTINHIHPEFIEQAHQSSAKYPANVSEFKQVGLTPEFRDSCPAPFVQESRIKYALSLEEIIPIKLNDTFLVIGKVMFVELSGMQPKEDGFLPIDEAGTVCSNGGDGYYSTNLLTRLSYAKPESWPVKLP